MKKRGLNLSLRIFAIFLAIFAITLYLPNNVVSISAQTIDDNVKASIKSDSGYEAETEYITQAGYVENETECVDTEEAESFQGDSLTR